MKVLGIVAEFNPFHKGHKYFIEQAKQCINSDYTIVVMSGNFTQRGEAAICNKWIRSKVAVLEGVDLVFELPFIFACNRADIFASGAIDILRNVGVTDIVFGSETGNIKKLEEFVAEQNKNKEEINFIREKYMQDGNSYAKGNELACIDVLGEEITKIIEKPNNILGIEYLKRIRYWNENGYNINAHTIKRYKANYYERKTEIAGGGAIRELLNKNNDISYISEFITDKMKIELEKKIDFVKRDENIFKLLKAILIRENTNELSKIYLLGEGIENKFKNEIIKCKDFSEFIDKMVSKRYSRAVIKRMITYILIGINGENMRFDLYARVLAAGEKGRKYLRILKEVSKETTEDKKKNIKKEIDNNFLIITNPNKDVDNKKNDIEILEYDYKASDIYNIVNEYDIYQYSDKVIKPYIK